MPDRIDQVVLNWLHGVLKPNYQNSQRVFDDVADMLYSTSTIRLKTDVYTYESGRSQLLLLLYGTIPVTYNGSTFNVPINIWLPHEYPHLAPMFFIAAVGGIGIRPGNYVDINRRCYHPYLAYWSDDVRRSNLTNAIVNLQTAFALEPPVFATTSTPSVESRRMPALDYPASQSQRPPKIPAKVTDGQNSNPAASSVENLRSSGAPTIPSKIGLTGDLQDHKTEPIIHDVSNGREAQKQQRAKTPPQQIPAASDLQNHDTPSMINSQRAQILRAIAAEAHSSAKSFQSNISNAQDQLLELENYECQLIDRIEKLTHLRSVSASNVKLLESKMDQSTKLIQNIELAGPIDTRSSVVAQNVVYNQLYELVADESALDDTIYALGKALEKEKLDIDLFLRTVRYLAREQFLQRALIDKISTTLNLQI